MFTILLYVALAWLAFSVAAATTLFLVKVFHDRRPPPGEDSMRAYVVAFQARDTWVVRLHSTELRESAYVGTFPTQRKAIVYARSRAIADRCVVAWYSEAGEYQGGASYRDGHLE